MEPVLAYPDDIIVVAETLHVHTDDRRCAHCGTSAAVVSLTEV